MTDTEKPAPGEPTGGGEQHRDSDTHDTNWTRLEPDMRLLAWESLPGIDVADENAAERAAAEGVTLYIKTEHTDPAAIPGMAQHNTAAFKEWGDRKPKTATAPAGTTSGRHPWVTKAVSDELAMLRDAARGSRNDTLNRVALRLARLLPDNRGWLHDALVDACDANGLITDDGVKSVEATTRSAFGKADRDGPAEVPRSGINAEEVSNALDTSPADDVVRHFWSARPVLAHIQGFARSRMVGPWGVLGVVLVRAVCELPPEVQLPSTIGEPASLNMLVALVGGSGVGKGGCEQVGRAAVRFRNGADEIDELPLGSGEGIARSLTVGDDEQRHPVVFTASEIDSVAALFTRRGSTLEPELRKLYSGETLGFTNAQKHTRTKVAAHTYRACLITGVQPTRGTFLLNGADAGTPQRFLWLPVDDPDAPDVTPQRVDPFIVNIPAMFGPGANMTSPDRSEVVVPTSIQQQLRAHRLDVLRGAPGVDPLDGHRMLCRLKVATGLMALDSRQQISDEDWQLAGTVLAMSDHTRESVARAGTEKARQANLARARADVERDEYAEASKLKSTKENLLRRLEKAEGETVARSDLRRAMRMDRREYFDAAITELTDEGLLDEVKLPNGIGYRGVQK
ncbi:hypothetical protein [Mycolicibacterium hippocampi]|uniref:Uncharacterized protein n=1 Tax=Mycolicibacterium hippocampi TaxID=659824 RepID=A0A7I9ZW37_9MYCO|nr:hypothetical protein [Mycolicibacterium hippocampi]GFH05039.1 hypothetical protein MHIP_55220 [Mycolicibacterium hippocampi]